MAKTRTNADGPSIIGAIVFLVAILLMAHFLISMIKHHFNSNYTGIMHSSVTTTIKQSKHHKPHLYDGDQRVICTDDDCTAHKLQSGQQAVLEACTQKGDKVVCTKLVRIEH